MGNFRLPQLGIIGLPLTHLGPLPILPQPFDHVATRTVGEDALVHFEGRQYSVPFVYLGCQVELRGALRQPLTMLVEQRRTPTTSRR